MAAGIEEGVIKPNTVFDEDGPVKIGEYSIKTWNNQYEGRITMTRVLEKSSNVGMVYVGAKLGDKRLMDYIKKYGFGELTGIDLQGEVPGYLKPAGEWYPIDYATATFGQGLAVSPIQMVRAFSSVINGGELMVPHVVKKLVGSSREQTIERDVSRRIVKKEVSDQVKQMLLSTIENGETKFLKPTGYQIGGKTGTAQIAIEGHYDASKTIASFIGFSPIEKPSFVALVVLKEPTSSQWGSETAAPIFFEIAKELIVYYNIAPE
jgi:cell division protein FtsI/penicillin-binding protein 2